MGLDCAGRTMGDRGAVVAGRACAATGRRGGEHTASLGDFWLFVGFGRGQLAFYKILNASASATFTNVAFYDASENPGSVPGERFYTGLVDAFATWMRQPPTHTATTPTELTKRSVEGGASVLGCHETAQRATPDR